MRRQGLEPRARGSESGADTVETVRIRPACRLACGDQPRLVWRRPRRFSGVAPRFAARRRCCLYLPPSFSQLPSLGPWPSCQGSRSGLALTQRTRLRSSEARRTSPAVFACTSTGHLYPSLCPGVTDGLGARWRRPIIAKRRGMGSLCTFPVHVLVDQARHHQLRGAGLAMRRRGDHTPGCRACYSSFSGI